MMKTCNKCLKNVKLHLTCFKCSSIYHPKCLLRVPTVYVNEMGLTFCCRNLTSKSNTFENRLEIQEITNEKCNEKDVRGVNEGLEDSIPKQGDCGRGKNTCDTSFEKEKRVEEANGYTVDFVCTFCEMIFFKEKPYSQHIKLCKRNNLRLNAKKDATIRKKLHKCNTCTYTTRWLSRMKPHLTTHLREKPFKCSMCEYKSGFKETLKRHILTMHSNEEQLFKCNDCSYSTRNKYLLRKHISIHLGEKPKLYKCSKCTYSSQWTNSVKLHSSTHLREKPFKCSKCKYKSGFKAALQRHILRMHSNKEKLFQCNDCSYRTHEKYNLREHISIHLGEKPFKCSICEFATIYKRCLSKHMASRHGSR